jgi:hypothetical protein
MIFVDNKRYQRKYLTSDKDKQDSYISEAVIKSFCAFYSVFSLDKVI